MCSKYELTCKARDLVVRFDLSDEPASMSGPVLWPNKEALVVDSGRHARLLHWGLSVSWDVKALINARAETLQNKKTFQPLLANRCLVPATGYFEWRRAGRNRLINRIAPADGSAFAFAGLMDGDRFTIITCAPHTSIAHIHNRMPVILNPDAEELWLDSNQPFRKVERLLVPYGPAPLSATEEPPKEPELFE